ncbi:MAG: hypothetical protein ACFFCS_11020 [Candidatus Hodarchaeota archaeon]
MTNGKERDIMGYLEKKKEMAEKEREFMNKMERTQDLIDNKDYEKAIEIYKELIPLSQDMKWTDKANMLKDLIQETRDKAEKDALEKERKETSMERKQREKFLYNEALDIMGRASESYKNKKLEEALDLYKECIKTFQEIDSTREIQMARTQISTIEAEMEAIKKKKEEEEAKQKEIEEAYKTRVSALSKEKDVMDRHQERHADEKQKAKLRYNEALEIMDQASEKYKRNNLQGALDLYKQSFEIFDALKSMREVELVQTEINSIEGRIKEQKEMEELKKKTELEEKSARELKEKEMEEQRRKREEKEALEMKKKAELEEKKAQETKLLDDAMDMLDKANKLLKRARTTHSISVEAKKERYEEVISIYEYAADNLKKIDWIDEWDRVKESIIKIKNEKNHALEELTLKLAKEAKTSSLEEGIPAALAAEKAIASKDTEDAEALKKKLEEQELREKALTALDEASKKLDEFERKPRVIGGQLFRGNQYPEIMRMYNKALGLFKQIGWVDEAAKIEESLVIIEKKEKDFLTEKEIFESSAAEAEKKAVFEKKWRLDRKQQEALARLKRGQLRDSKKQEEKEIQDQIDQHLDNAMSAYKKEELRNAEEEYLKAHELMKEQGWTTQAENVWDTIEMIKKKRETLEDQLVKKERMVGESGAFERGIEQLDETMKVMEEQEKMEDDSEKQKLMKEKAEQKQKEEALIEFLADAQKFLKDKNFKDAIEAYNKAEKLAVELNWTSQIHDIQDYIQEATQQKEEYNVSEARKEEEAKKQRILAAQIRGQLDEKEKAQDDVEAREKRELERKRSEEAYAILDEANAQLKKGEKQESMEKFIAAKKIFEEIGWERETDMVEEQLTSIKRDLHKEATIKEKEAEAEKTKEAYDAMNEAEKLIRDKKPEDAIKKFEEAIEIFEMVNWDKEANMIRAQIKKVQDDMKEAVVVQEAVTDQEKIDKAFALIDEAKKYQRDRKIFKAVEFAHQALDVFETLEEDWERELQQVRKFVDELVKEKEKKEELIKKLKLGEL